MSASLEEAGRAWLRDQLLLHSDDIDGGTASDLAGYVFVMSSHDAAEYLAELMPHLSKARVAKICAELGRRKGHATPPAPAAAPLNVAAKSWGPRKDGKPRSSKSKKGTLILSNTATRQGPKSAARENAKELSKKKKKEKIDTSADAQKIAAQLNPFLAGAPPAKFVANCLCCGAIVWYNEREEKVCNSGKSKYCHNLLLDACDPETGLPDPDYALTKKARKKKRRAREEREAMVAATASTGDDATSHDSIRGEKEEDQSSPVVASASLTAARARTERLVGFDKKRSARSEVYDDQSDYFQDASSSWLSPEERKAAQAMGEAKRKEAEDKKRNVRVTFDFAGRRVVEIVEEADVLDEKQARAPIKLAEGLEGRGSDSLPVGPVPVMESSDDFPIGAMPKSNALYGRAAAIYAGLVDRLQERAEEAAEK